MSGKTPGQAAFSAFDARMVKTSPWRDARMTHDEAWASLTDEDRDAWEAAAQASVAADNALAAMRDAVPQPAQAAPELAAAMAETRQLRALVADILGEFRDSGDGRRARVGQVQIAKWRQRAGLEG